MIEVVLTPIGRVRFKAIVESDDSPIENQGGTDLIKALRAAKRRNPVWGWCAIVVYAWIDGMDEIYGEATLTESSFKGVKDFVSSEAHGYLPELRQDAFDKLWAKLEVIQKQFPSAVEIEQAQKTLSQDLQESYERSRKSFDQMNQH